MPAKGLSLLTGQRTRLLSRRNPLYKKFIKDTGIEMDMNTFKKIIRTTCRKMGECIANDPDGLQLPEIGYVVVSKSKPRTPPINRVESKRLGKLIPFLNLHSFGYVHRIKWYTGGMRVKNISIYKLKPLKKVKKSLSNNIIKGVNFFEWSSSDLWSATSLERRFGNSYKKDN